MHSAREMLDIMKCLQSFNIIYTISLLILLLQRSSVDASGQVGKLQYRWCNHYNHIRTQHISCEKSRKKFNAVDMTIQNYIDHDDRHLRTLYSASSIPTLFRHRCLSRSSKRIHILRGGSSNSISTSSSPPFVSSKENDQFIIHNPSYQQSHPSSDVTLGDLESSYASIRNSNNNDVSHHPRRRSNLKLRPIIANASTAIVAMQVLYQQYPLFTQITTACIFIFIAWHVPIQSFQNILNQYFICRRSHLTIRNGKFLSLVLSAVSHIGLQHLAYNLMALLSFGPSVQSILERKFATTGIIPRKYQHLSLFSSVNGAMGLLVIGAAISGSIAYLAWNEVCGTGSSAAGCLGLSAVTMALLSIYASVYPNQLLQFRFLGIIPIRLSADRMLLFLFIGSILGCIQPVIFQWTRSDGISHSGHLGGLIFGLAYYDMIIMNRRPFIDSFLVTFH